MLGSWPVPIPCAPRIPCTMGGTCKSAYYAYYAYYVLRTVSENRHTMRTTHTTYYATHLRITGCRISIQWTFEIQSTGNLKCDKIWKPNLTPINYRHHWAQIEIENRNWKGFPFFRMVYGMRSTHGMPSSQDTTGGYAKTGTPCVPGIPYTTGGCAKTCILCAPRIPYTTGGYAQICVPRVLSILHTMDAIGKQIVSPRPLRDAIRSNQRLVYGMRSTRSTWSSQGRWMGRRVQ